MKKLSYSTFLEQSKGVLPASFSETLFSLAQSRIEAPNHGDAGKWFSALEDLPNLDVSYDLNCDTLQIGTSEACSDSDREKLYAILQQFRPWRKGPFNFFGIQLDTEWRSDWKWNRLKNEIRPLSGRRVLDIGCGSGYHCWRMAGEGASIVVGVDPFFVFIMQYWCMREYIKREPVFVLPLRFEELPANSETFDTIFSMGVLYHCKQPVEHLKEIRNQLAPQGELVLETIIVESHESLEPTGRYAQMRNISIIPSIPQLKEWLIEAGYSNIRVIDITKTSLEEQHPTDWMVFDSLENFLDPNNINLTIEGYPAPVRAIVLAEK